MRVWLGIAMIALLAACTLTEPDEPDGAGVPVQGQNPITGDAITVTALDAPAATVGSATTDTSGKPVAVAKPDSAGSADGTGPDTAAVGAEAQAPPKPANTPDATAPAEAAPAKPAQVVTPEEAACLRKGGEWTAAGKSGARACVQPTRDGGKRCTKESQCEGACLARSNTCAPFKPLFGCNEILQDNGVMVTLCID